MNYYKNLVLELHKNQFFFYFLKPIEEILYNIRTSKNILLKDLLIIDDNREFLYKFINKQDLKDTLKPLIYKQNKKKKTPYLKSIKYKLIIKAKYKKEKRKYNKIEEKFKINNTKLNKSNYILNTLDYESEYIESIENNDKISNISNLYVESINNEKKIKEFSNDYYDIYNPDFDLVESKIIKKIKISFKFNELKYNEIISKQINESNMNVSFLQNKSKLVKKIINKKKKKKKDIKKCDTLRENLSPKKNYLNKKFSTNSIKNNDFSLKYFCKSKKTFPKYLNKIVNTFIFPNNKVDIKGSVNIIKNKSNKFNKSKVNINSKVSLSKISKKDFYLFSSKKKKKCYYY